MKNISALIQKMDENIDTIKEGILDYWNDLTEKQLKNITNYQTLVSELQAAYSFSDIEVETQILKFMEKMGLIPIEMYLEQLKRALYQSTTAATANLSRTLERSVDLIKESSGELQKNMTNYITQYPLRSVAISFVSGIVFYKLMKK